MDLVKKIRDKRVVLFAGAGLSLNAVNKVGILDKKIPLWRDLTREMLVKIYGQNYEKIEIDKYKYEYVADKFESQFGRNEIYNFLELMLEDSQYLPGDIHRLICQFDWEIVTTNFDTIIERAFESVRSEYNVIYDDADLTIKGHPRIYKINGCIKNARDEIILTGDDFRTFSKKKPLIELYIKKCFIESTVLFVGFSLDDPTFNMIHGWVRDHLQDKKVQRIAYSIQDNIDDVTKNVWYSRGIRFIELFPAGNVDKRLTEQRINALFQYLYEEQFNKQKEKKISVENKNDSAKEKKLFNDKLTRFAQKAEMYREDCKLECPDAQIELEHDLMESFAIVPIYKFFELCYEDSENDKGGSDTAGEKIIDFFINLVNTYLCVKSKEAVLYYLMKETIRYLDREEVFANKKISAGLRQLIEKLMIENSSDEMNNPNLWVIAMYIELWLFHNQKHTDLEFFKKGFSILDKTAREGGIDQRIPMDLHHYWLSTLLLIGPFKYAKSILKICRKTSIQKFDWDIPKKIHFHLEVFLDDRLKHLALFLAVINKLRMTDRSDAFYKFLLLNNFLKEYKRELNFSDLFNENSYQTLAGMFSEDMYEYRNVLAEIHCPIESGYFRKALHTIFKELLKGRSLLCTDISTFILSFPTFEMTENEMNTLKKSSLGELILLAMIYDIPVGEKKKQEDLKRFISFLIKNNLIDISYFLHLLLFRLEGVDLEEEPDNGISRYFNGLVSFFSCALPYLEDNDLKSIKDIIRSCLSGIKISGIREAFVQVVGYLSSQLTEDDFSSIYKDVFFLAERNTFESPVFHFLTLNKKDAEVLKYSRFLLILEKNLDNQGSSDDRDFILFLLNHRREDIIPADETIEKQMEIYFERLFMPTSHLSLQQMMDLQQFIEKGYVPLEESTEKRVKKFFIQASKYHAFYFEWKILSQKMIPVYKTFSYLMDPDLVEKIMDGFLKDPMGKEIPLAALEEKQVNGFAHQLKEIYYCPHHQGLKGKALIHVKNIIKEGFYGGGYLATFWEVLDGEEKKRLSEIMLSLWKPPEEKTIIKAIQATAEFLKYPTDKTTMDELTNLVTYTALYNSPPLKIESLKLFTLHAGQNTGWFKEHRERILNLLPYLRQEKDLSLLRKLIIFLRCLKPGQIKETILYLKEKAPYAEIRRAFSLENFKKKQS
ncbi:MAG: SIR2 family protein [Candidatus Aminicenantes bacterium]|nr:SIR2 family protein [Candidatus Aminicenantes bacterium]